MLTIIVAALMLDGWLYSVIRAAVALNDAALARDDGVTVGCEALEDLLHEHGDTVALP